MKKIIDRDLEKLVIVFLAVVCTLVLFADPSTAAGPDAGATFAPAPAAVPPIGVGILAYLQHLIGFTVPGWVLTLVTFTMTELVGRFVKTEKPWSMLYFFRDLFVYLATALNLGAGFLDKVLQNSNQSSNPVPAVKSVPTVPPAI